jgi:hypothetical protein
MPVEVRNLAIRTRMAAAIAWRIRAHIQCNRRGRGSASLLPQADVALDTAVRSGTDYGREIDVQLGGKLPRCRRDRRATL